MFTVRVHGAAAERSGIVDNRTTVEKNNPAVPKAPSPQYNVNTAPRGDAVERREERRRTRERYRINEGQEKLALYDTSN